MKTKAILLAIFIAAAFFANAQVKQDRNVAAFTSINIGGSFKIYLRMGEKSALTVIADKDVIDNVKSTVSNGVLEVDLDEDWWDDSNNGKIELYITVVNIREINLSGACTLETKNTIKAPTLDIDLSGATKLDAQLSCDILEMELSGASKITLTGNCTKLNVEASGASAIYAADLHTKISSIDASGACKAELKVANELNVDASGACKVYYSGNPTVNQNVSGAASVTKM